MPLDTQIIPISFYKGIDTKTDDKNSLPGELLILENGTFKETGKITKRNGFSSLTVSANSGNIYSGSALANFDNELIQFTGSDVLGFSEAENIWLGRGKDYQLSDKTTPIFSNDKAQQNPECKILNNLELYVWEDLDTGVKYSIIDHLNGAILLSNSTVDSHGSRPKVIIFNGQFVIIYYNSGRLYARTIDTDQIFSISDDILILDDINTDSPQYDVLSPEIEDGYFYLAYSQADLISSGLVYYSDISMIARTVYNNSSSCAGAVNIWEDNLNNIWVVGASINDITVKTILSLVCIRQKGHSETLVNSGFTINTTNEGQFINKICGFRSALSGENIIYYECTPFNEYLTLQSFNFGNYINRAVITTDGQIFSNNVFIRGLGLYSKPFLYNNINFILTTTNTEFQATYYLLDEKSTVVSRSNVNNGGGYKQNSIDGFPLNTCTDSIVIDGYGNILIPLEIKTAFVSNNNTTYLPTGINVVKYNFNVNNTISNITLGNNLNISGGVFKSYDGFNLVENNFFQFPEDILTHSAPIVLALTQTPTPILPQIATLNIFGGAYRIQQGSFFLISSLTATYGVWFNKNNQGIPPLLIGYVLVEVNIGSYDSELNVLNKIAMALPIGEFSTSISNTSLIITNKIIGVGTISPPNGNFMNSTGIAAGTYLYSAIYEWIDSFGQINRSGTSVPISVTTNGFSTISIIVPTLRITEKQNAKIVIYRTENLGDSIFYRITDLVTPLQNDETIDWVSFIDIANDDQIIGNDFIYTTGGTLDNSAPPSSTLSVLFKNRIFIGGLEDANLLWFSKINSTGSPVEFSDFLTFKCDPRFGAITALGVLDDKLVIFKENGMFALVGNGPDNTGAGNDYNTSFANISTDVGCIDEKSVVITPIGLMFKSKKGIYLLDRGLGTSYIGAQVQKYNDLVITSAIVNPVNNQVRFTSEDGTMLVYDYFIQQWSTFTNLPAVDAIFINSNYYLLKPNGVVYKEDNTVFTDDGNFIQLRLQTGWLSFAKLQGYQRIRRALILGSYIGKHQLNVSFYYNFNNSPPQFALIDAGTLIGDNDTWGSDPTWGDSDLWGGEFIPYEFNIHLTVQKCTSFKIEIFDTEELNFNEGYDISNIAFEVGIKKGTNKLAPKNKFGNST